MAGGALMHETARDEYSHHDWVPEVWEILLPSRRDSSGQLRRVNDMTSGVANVFVESCTDTLSSKKGRIVATLAMGQAIRFHEMALKGGGVGSMHRRLPCKQRNLFREPLLARTIPFASF